MNKNREKKTIIDVRTMPEFNMGHAPDSINIPLNELPERIKEIKQLPQPVILCCASGVRSAMAYQILKNSGIEECYNGGSWINVNNLKTA